MLQVSDEGIPGHGSERYTKWEGCVLGIATLKSAHTRR